MVISHAEHLLSNGSVAELGTSSVVDLVGEDFLQLLWDTLLNGLELLLVIDGSME